MCPHSPSLNLDFCVWFWHSRCPSHRNTLQEEFNAQCPLLPPPAWVTCGLCKGRQWSQDPFNALYLWRQVSSSHLTLKLREEASGLLPLAPWLVSGINFLPACPPAASVHSAPFVPAHNPRNGQQPNGRLEVLWNS